MRIKSTSPIAVAHRILMYFRENEASLAVLPDLLSELDAMPLVCYGSLFLLREHLRLIRLWFLGARKFVAGSC